MKVKLDTNLAEFERQGGDQKFIENITTLLKIDKSLMIITGKR